MLADSPFEENNVFCFGWSNSIIMMKLFRWFDDVNYQREALSLEVVHRILFIFFKCEIK